MKWRGGRKSLSQAEKGEDRYLERWEKREWYKCFVDSECNDGGMKNEEERGRVEVEGEEVLMGDERGAKTRRNGEERKERKKARRKTCDRRSYFTGGGRYFLFLFPLSPGYP